MEVEEDSITDAPLTPADVAVISTALAQSNASPLTRAIQSQNTNRRSHPDAALTREMEFRRLDAPPVDLLGVEPGDDNMTGAVRNACKFLHDQWADIREASQNRDVNLDQLSKAGQRVLNVALDPLDRCRKELDIRIADNQREIDQVVCARVEPVLAGDIRRAFAEKAKRNGGLDDIRKSVVVASAVLTAPGLVMGATDERMGQYREIAENAHAPKLLERKRHLQKLRVQTERAEQYAIERLRPALMRWTAQQSPAMKRLMAS